MNSEEDRIRELIFALRKDFKISKEIVNALSKIGPGVIPHLIDAYKIDDFAFKLKIIETLGKMSELGLTGLVELVDVSDVKIKATILKTIKKMEKYSRETNNRLIDELEAILLWAPLEYKNFQDLTDQINDLQSFRDYLAEILLASKMNRNNTERINEIVFLTFHIYLRKIQNKKINDEMKVFYSKLKENKTIQLIELEDIYKDLLKLDSRLSEIFKSYLTSNFEKFVKRDVDKLLMLMEEKLSRYIIYKACDKNFYLHNYDSTIIRNYINVQFFYRIVEFFTKIDVDALDELTTFENLKGIITELTRDLYYALDDVSLEDIIGAVGRNQSIMNDTVNLDLSVKQLSEVNLENLRDFIYLEFLTLEENQLTTIDISSLQKCINLQHLVLSKNKLSSLDLSPLSKCPKIEWLDFSNNLMTTINLNPLSELVNLLELKLNENKLTSIDLGPLSECNQLLEIDLTKNNIQILDVTPLEKCKQLEFLGIDETTKLLWNKSNIPERENLSQGLQEHYSKLTVAK